MAFKEYLGDSVYVETDETGGVTLTTENGYPTDPSNVIYLEPEVLDMFFRYVKRVQFIKKIDLGGSDGEEG